MSFHGNKAMDRNWYWCWWCGRDIASEAFDGRPYCDSCFFELHADQGAIGLGVIEEDPILDDGVRALEDALSSL